MEARHTLPGSPPVAIVLRTLATLRWLAVIGQSIAIVVADAVLGLPLAYGPLLAGLAALVAFGIHASLRAGRIAGSRTVLGHLAFDLGQLTWQLWWSGGAANPFVSLYLVPIALAGLALPVRQVVAVAALAAAGYSLLMVAGRQLPNWHHHHAALFDLHLVGMWVNFLLSAAILTAIAARLARTLDRARRERAAAREAALRGEGLVAVATQAAATAHALNTPLGSIAVLAGELARRFPPGTEVGDDLALLRQQVDVCRDALRRLVSEAALERTGPEPLAAIVERAAERLALLRPESRVETRIEPAAAALRIGDPAALEHLALNLLGNAVDASGVAGSHYAALEAAVDGSSLVLGFCDRGPGLAQRPAPFRSGKADGLGLGFLLAEMIAERFGGRLTAARDGERGRVVVRLPIVEGQVVPA